MQLLVLPPMPSSHHGLQSGGYHSATTIMRGPEAPGQREYCETRVATEMGLQLAFRSSKAFTYSNKSVLMISCPCIDGLQLLVKLSCIGLVCSTNTCAASGCPLTCITQCVSVSACQLTAPHNYIMTPCASASTCQPTCTMPCVSTSACQHAAPRTTMCVSFSLLIQCSHV